VLNKILFFCLLVCSSFLGAMEWHSWDELPKKGELYMYTVFLEETLEIDGITHVIRRFDPEKPVFHVENRGWWSISRDTVWWLIQKNNKVIYLP